MSDEQIDQIVAADDFYLEVDQESEIVGTEMSVGDEGMKITTVPAIEVLSKVQLETQAIAKLRNEENIAAAQHFDEVSFSFGANVPCSDDDEEKKLPQPIALANSNRQQQSNRESISDSWVSYSSVGVENIIIDVGEEGRANPTSLDQLLQLVVKAPAQPDWIKLIVDELGFRQEKVDTLVETHYVQSAAEFLDAFAPDKENGLHQHKFMSKNDKTTKPVAEMTEEEKKEYEANNICKVCDKESKKHVTYSVCKICCEMYPLEEMFTLIACGHEYCIQCVRAHLEKLIEGCEVSKLKCLDYECQMTFFDEELKQVLNDEMFAKMKRFLLALKVARDDDLFYCPNTKCGESLSQKELKKENKKGNLTCKHCQTSICRKCLLTTHDGKKCTLSNDTKFRLWATRGVGVKNCPICGARTQKNDGCNHMHCGRCQTDWCWICNQVANELHYELTFKNLFKGCPGL